MPHTGQKPVDPDFAEEILAELYAYRPKRKWLAYLLWGTLGWFGAHRFYMGRPLTGLLMLFSLGGALVWWFVDIFLIGGMVRHHNEEQEQRRRVGLPPLELSFMPPLWRNVLDQPPEWTRRWREAGNVARARRMTGDVLVLVMTGLLLGAVARAADVWEAILAVVVLVIVVTAGAAVGRFGHLPVVHGLIRWSHRLRLFYYYSPPGSPLAMLFRPVTAAILAPFRRRDRAEVRLYLQLGGVITLFFLILDFGGEVLGPILRSGTLPSPFAVLILWIREATVTFVVIYAFATPIGAILTQYLLMLRTHTVPRVLGALVLLSVLLGIAL
ncbi:hypothetical protein BH23GEM9_BH23GEM9_25650 [soil metagenome]